MSRVMDLVVICILRTPRCVVTPPMFVEVMNEMDVAVSRGLGCAV